MWSGVCTHLEATLRNVEKEVSRDRRPYDHQAADWPGSLLRSHHSTVLAASTTALQADDPTYNAIEASLANLVGRRDALAAPIRAALDASAFADQAIDSTQAQTWTNQAQALLTDASALAAGH